MSRGNQKARKSGADAPKRYNAITDVPGIEVGHCTDIDNLTGTTVILTGTGRLPGSMSAAPHRAPGKQTPSIRSIL